MEKERPPEGCGTDKAFITIIDNGVILPSLFSSSAFLFKYIKIVVFNQISLLGLNQYKNQMKR